MHTATASDFTESIFPASRIWFFPNTNWPFLFMAVFGTDTKDVFLCFIPIPKQRLLEGKTRWKCETWWKTNWKPDRTGREGSCDMGVRIKAKALYDRRNPATNKFQYNRTNGLLFLPEQEDEEPSRQMNVSCFQSIGKYHIRNFSNSI